MSAARLVIYGATGYTGELIAREAVRRGLRPVLAGRNEVAVATLARELGCDHRVASLDDPGALDRALQGATVTLHCAGPFSATSAPMVEACLRQRSHYLDITGEIDVLEAIHARDAAARQAGVVLCPATGFDVVPTDCVAARIKQELPDATYLALGFASTGRPSRGTLKTSIENLSRGGRIRSAGRITPVAHAFRRARHRFRRGRAHGGDDPVGRREHRLLDDRHRQHRVLHRDAGGQHRQAQAPEHVRRAAAVWSAAGDC